MSLRFSEEEYQNLINRRAEAMKDMAHQLNIPVPRNVRKLAEETISLAAFPVKAVKPNKFRAQKVVIDGITFHSKKEGARYQQLKMMEKGGKISHLTLQQPFDLACAVTINGKKKQPLRYVADFCYTENGNNVVEDTKGFRDALYKIKRHLMKAVHGIEIKET